MKNKQMKQWVKQAEAQGFEVRITSKGHIQFKKDGQIVAVAASTPSDPRSWKNLIADLKRAGFKP